MTTIAPFQTNPLDNPAAFHAEVNEFMHLDSFAAAGGQIIRFRLLTEVVPGVGRCADVSYIVGRLPGGELVRVYNGGIAPLTPLRVMKRCLIEWGNRVNVNMKSIGFLNEGNWSVMH